MGGHGEVWAVNSTSLGYMELVKDYRVNCVIRV